MSDIHVYRTNSYCQVDAPDSVHEALASFCSVPVRATKGPLGAYEILDFYDTVLHAFPPGLFNPCVEMLKEQAKKLGGQCFIHDERKVPGPVDRSNESRMGLWDHQREAVDAVFEHTVLVIKAGTGAGKTRMTSAIIDATPDTKWLVVVHRDTIRKQIAEELRAWLLPEDVSCIGSDVNEGFGRVTVTTYDALNTIPNQALTKALRKMTGLIVDECHVAAAATYNAIVAECTNAYYRIGLSATPNDRSDARSALATVQLGKVEYEISAEELIAKGILAAADVTFVRFEQPAVLVGGRLTGKRWQAMYSNLVVKNQRRNDVIVGLASVAPKPCLVSFKSLAHGRELKRRLEAMGFNTVLVDGTTHTSARSNVAKQVKHGYADIVLASVVFNEGVNIPEVVSMVNAAAGKSVIQTIQRLGRVLRKAPGKDSAYVFDIFDDNNKWLHEHASQRYRTIKGEGHKTRIVDTLHEAVV